MKKLVLALKTNEYVRQIVSGESKHIKTGYQQRLSKDIQCKPHTLQQLKGLIVNKFKRLQPKKSKLKYSMQMEARVHSSFEPQDRVNRGEMTKYIKRNTQDLTEHVFFLLTSRQTTRLFWFTDKSNKELLSVCIKVSFSALARLSFRALFCMCM